MDFFERQDWARRRTALLLALFTLAVLLLVALVLTVVWLALSFHPGLAPPSFALWLAQPLAWWVGGGTAAVIAVGSLRRWWQLGERGGDRVARMLGGRRLDGEGETRGERMLVDVVEESAIAAGVGVPGIYLLDDEPGLNAFAAGRGPGDAVIAVTRGLLDGLERDQLQGVIAHEMSHVVNGDIRLNLRMLAVLAGIETLGELGAWLWHGGGSRGYGRRYGRAGALVVLGLALRLIGGIGVLIARIIKAAVSRHREFLADAAAVQFTRNPDGIGGALLSIHRASAGSLLRARHAELISHMGFSRTVDGWSRLTASHPSIEARMAALGPRWAGRHRRQQRAMDRERARRARKRESRGEGGSGAGGVGASPAVPMPLPDAVTDTLSVAAIAAIAGHLDRRGLTAARRLLDRVPADVRAAAHDTARAPLVVYALLMHGPSHREADLAAVPADLRPAVTALRESLELGCGGAATGTLDPSARLAVLELALPAVARMAASDRDRFTAVVDALVRADGRFSVFEYAARALLQHHLVPRERGIGVARLAQRRGDVEQVMALLAHAGGGDEATRRAAYSRAVAALAADLPEPADQLPSLAACSQAGFSTALERLTALQPRDKRTLLTAATACIAADDRIRPAEAELVRVLSAALMVPLPLLDSVGEGVAGP